ncbi:McrB family protein [Clostridium autoethanogenum]|uniref:AAA family ATPase n=1 Tax=Clostridium autoethanogenum DSM 10061 TaxID=1341692 RepID=A0ABN4BJH4_9CLOT|nr:AAA family ATPase [Clostridium autoethanogenum]AGY77762.1 AAA family ATPase [Clostridium autoethanogenum DSM 10061]ALU37898.1 ATPase associated with various cellular activities AAA_5 [Clostridium autoethanogenum DSM 10061]OVY49751.1 5-methylcytosine-specific restriction enzyme B [Clostridium autoethanogenum]
MDQTLNMVLKYNDSVYSIDTIKEHRDIQNSCGKVIWEIIKPKVDSPGVSTKKIIKIKEQIKNNIKTYAYMATSGQIKAKGEVIDILTIDEVSENSHLVPKYYRKDLDKCAVGILLKNVENEDPTIIDKLQRYGTNGGIIALSNQTNPLYVSFKNIDDNSIYNSLTDKSVENIKADEVVEISEEEIKNFIEDINEYVNSLGYIYTFEDLSNFYLSLKTKPFVILVGISGTGKSKIVRLFAEAIGANTGNGRFRMISVKPDWNDSTELFGYKNINDEFIPGQLTEIIKEASIHKNMPYFVCIDEMNLSRVEYYLSEYLSLIESRKVENNEIITDNIFSNSYINNKYCELYIPENLYIVGTVNMDDTTFQFSRKVLDRANTIEFSEVDLSKLFLNNKETQEFVNENISNNFMKANYLNINDIEEEYRNFAILINKKIIKINEILKKAKKHFAYRVRDEIIFYMIENKKAELLDENLAFDYQIMQNILPAISGSEAIIKDTLVELFNFCLGKEAILSDSNYLEDAGNYLKDAVYYKSASKILDMLRGYKYDGFATYWF